MATYDELSKYLDEYEAGPQQQQLGVNFNAPEQEETPYQKMMRETYGSPAQVQQEEPGLLGSIVNRVSGQPQQHGAEEPSFLGSAFRGAMAQGIGTLGGQADFVAGATGSETLHNLGDSAQKAMQEYGRPHEYTANEIFGSGLSGLWKYLSDPNGAAYDVGGGLGSTAAMAAEAALLSAALPSSVAAAGTGAVAAFATRLGLKSVAGALSKGGTAAKLIKNVIASTPLEAASESGGTYREMTTDEQGNRLNPEDLDMDKVQEAMAKNFVGNLGVLGASNLLESVGIGKLFGDKMRSGILGKVRDIGTFMATNAGQNAWEEGAQTGTNLYAQGKLDNISQIVNPFEWNEEQQNAAAIGGVAGFGQGALYGGAGHVMNKIAGPQQQEGENPAVNIQNAVTNNEFADAVAIAKHDTSTNLVDRMRNLEGRIGHHASDGTNCARTIGLALAGTDYQDLINVDDFVKVAQQKGQLQDPANYVPKPGDLAVVNNGNHIVMVSENGGTIQNGSSHDGVYESSQSPLQMFGAVKYYISTSGMSSGEYGVAGNLQGVNEDQRKEDYYQNLVAQESQRRADAIRDVLGAKTHEQEQQEQAVSEAQKYQQDNASELGPINEYYNAFTGQELDALSPEEKQTLKNNFDSFYADKQNWGHTAIEKVQMARGMYNQLLANRQQTATVNNANKTVTQPTPNSTQSAPNVTQTANTTANTTEVENPVVQQQQAQQNQDVAKNATTTTPATEQQQQVQQPVAQENNDEATPLTGYQPTEAQLNQARQDIAKQREEQLASDVRLDRDLLNTAKAAKRGVKSAVAKMQKLPENVRKLAESEIETPREKLIDMINDDLATKKRGLKKEQHAPLVAQANQAFQKGFQLLNEGKTAEEAFEAVKNDIVKPTKEGKKNGTSQKSEKLSQPETGENRNPNPNTESEKVKREENKNGESTENKNQAEVTKKTPAKRHIDGFKNEVDAAVKSMTFTQEKADELVQKYNNSLDILLQRGEITQAEADANRYAMEDSVKRGLILNDGRKLLSPKVRKWLDDHPFAYDKSKSREENIAAAQKLKEDFIKATGISSTANVKPTPERTQLRKRILDYLYNVGAEKRKRERKASLLIGFPAAGKSTLSNDLIDNKGYLLIDADEAKKLLPEFHNGVLADIVHDESSDLSKSLFGYAIEHGDNICYPTIGGKYDSIKKKVVALHNDYASDDEKITDENGNAVPAYDVTLSYVDVTADEALRRIYNRFEETGRFDNPKNISELVLQKNDGRVTIQLPDGERKNRLGSTETVPIDNAILKNYIKIKNEGSVEQYEWIDNGLPVGASYGEMLRESGRLSGRPDGRRESGVGQSGERTESGNSSRKVGKTEKQQQVNRADTEDQSGSSIFSENEVNKNGSNESGLSGVSETEQAGTVSADAEGRETGAVPGPADGTSEKVSQPNDEAVRNRASESRPARTRRLSGKSENVGGNTNEQATVWGRISRTVRAFANSIHQLCADHEDDKVALDDLREEVEDTLDKIDKEIGKADKTTAQQDYDNYFKYITVNVGGKEYHAELFTGPKGQDAIRWVTNAGSLADRGSKRSLGILMWHALTSRDANGNYPTLDKVISSIEKYYKKNKDAQIPQAYQDAIDYGKQLKKQKKDLVVTDNRPDNTTKYSAQQDKAQVKEQNTEQEEQKRSLDDLITEAKRAFKGATKFRINRENLIFTMPNGLELVVNPRDQIILKAEDEAKARKEHGLNEGGIVVEGYAKRLDKGSLIALSKESREGTTFHEAFHTIWDWVLTDKEKAAMLKHFTPIAKEKGIDVEEAMADGYRDWLLARRQHKGTMFGKLFQKIKDFANAALRVLTGTDNVDDIYRQIEEGKVWNRDAKGRFATEENANTYTAEDGTRFSVNADVNPDAPIKIVDLTKKVPKSMQNNASVMNFITALAKNGTTFTDSEQKAVVSVLPKDIKHVTYSSKPIKYPMERKAHTSGIYGIKNVIKDSVLIESIPNKKTGSKPDVIAYHRFYTPVQIGNRIYAIRSVAEEHNNGVLTLNPTEVNLYDVIVERSRPVGSYTSYAVAADGSATISIRDMLTNVKDYYGKTYFSARKASQPNTKYSVRLASGKEVTSADFPSDFSTSKPGGEEAITDPQMELTFADYKSAQKDKDFFDKVIEKTKQVVGLDVPAKDSKEASEQMIERMVENIRFLLNKVPEEYRDRAKRWYEGGNKIAKTWAERYGLPKQATAGVIAVLSPQMDWFTNVTLAERVLDAVYGHANERWSNKMTAIAKQIVSTDNKEAKVNLPALKRAKGKTLKELIANGDYRAAAIWVRCYDQCYNDRGYRILTPEGGVGDYVKTDTDENATAAWGNYGPIEKAISIAANPSYANIFYQLGDKHKVRNFANNLNNPDSEFFTTVDTHAVGVGLMQPVSSTKSNSVLQNFGTGSSSSKSVGMSGSYFLYYEAIRRVAEETGLKPREVQSITWEAIRSLFPPHMKFGSEAQQKILELWRQGDEEIKNLEDPNDKEKVKEILDKIRNQVYDIGTEQTGVLREFDWANTPFDATTNDTYKRSNVKIQKFDKRENGKGGSSFGIEAAPDPNNKELTELWEKVKKQNPQLAQQISDEVVENTIRKVFREFGLDFNPHTDLVPRLGGYLGATNPSYELVIENPNLLLPISKMLGKALNQDSVMLVSSQEALGTTPHDILSISLPDGWGDAEIDEFYQKLYEIKGPKDEDGNPVDLFTGHSTSNGVMTIVNTDDLPVELLLNGIKSVAPNISVETSNGYCGFVSKDEYGFVDENEKEQKPEEVVRVQIPNGWSKKQANALAKKISGLKNKKGVVLASSTSTEKGMMTIEKADKVGMKTLLDAVKTIAPDLTVTKENKDAGLNTEFVPKKTDDRRANLIQREATEELESKLLAATGSDLQEDGSGLDERKGRGDERRNLKEDGGVQEEVPGKAGNQARKVTTEQTKESTQGDEGASSMPENATEDDLENAKMSVRPGNELAVKIPNGKREDGSTVKFGEALVTGKKHGETRFHKNLPKNKWVGVSVDGKIIGRVKFGDPYLINKDSAEYTDSMIEGVKDIDLTEERPEKYYYPVLDRQDFRENPIEAEKNGPWYQQYPLPSDAKYSITSTLGNAIDKAESYTNRNVREPNQQTATGRAARAFNNTQNKNNAQTFTEWLKDRFTKFYREWFDKNDALHDVDDAIEKVTGKKLAEADKIYNQAQGARSYAQGAAQTLVQGTKEAFKSLKDSLERGIDPKDTAAMDRLKELKKDFNYATMQQVLEPIMTKDMDRKYPDYLEKNGLNNWHDAFSNYLGARRILELVRLVEDKSLQYITHDKKQFTDFIDRHPEYEKFRPQPFAKGTWRDQVQKMAQADPDLAEKMAKDLAKEYKFPKGVSRADLEAMVAEAPKEFGTSADIYYQLQRNLLTMMELGHLIPADVHDKINKMYKDYCPLMIDYSDTAGLETAIAQFGRGADSIANVDSMLKHVLQLGSERGLISPLESTYKSIQALTNRSERNKVAVHLVKTVANSPELRKSGILTEVDGKASPDAKNCIFTVLINGKKVAFQTTQDLYGPIVGYDMPAAGIVEGFCRSAAQALRYGATTSPSFIIRNFIRDTIFAGISSRNGFVPVVDSMKGLLAYWHNKELRGEFDAMGITAYNYFGSGKNAVKSMEELMGEKDWQYLKEHPTQLIKELVKSVPKFIEFASESIEASTRMGEYMRARKNGKSMQEAALDARDVTLDFSRSGFYGQRVNMMVPFFNACLQGGDKMFNRMLFSKDPKVRMQTARMVGLYIMLPSMILWAMHKDEPWYEELDPHIKMNNWIIGKFRIPKPQEAGIAFGSGIEAMLDKIYDKDPKAGKEWRAALLDTMLPNLIPTVGLPMLEWITNYSIFRDKAIEGNRLKRLPVEMRYNTGTTEISKALSKAVGGAYGASPVKLDNTIRGYTGTLGMLVAQIPDAFFESRQNLPSKNVTERMMVRDFFINDMNLNRTSEDFYNLVNAAQQQHAGYGKKGKPTQDVKAINKALRDVSKQQKDIQTITDAKGISQDRKRQMIDKKRDIIKTIQKATLKRYGNKYDI